MTELHDILPRHRTPPQRLPGGGTRHTVQRCCNGCGEQVGDVTMAEILAAIDGRRLPDVRAECPQCRPGLEPPLRPGPDGVGRQPADLPFPRRRGSSTGRGTGA